MANRIEKSNNTKHDSLSVLSSSIPPPWRLGDDRSAIEAFAADLGSADTRQFLLDIKQAAGRYSWALYLSAAEPAEVLQRSRDELTRLETSARAFAKARAALDAFGEKRFLLAAKGEINEVDPWGFAFLFAADNSPNRARVEAVTELANEVADWAAQALASVPEKGSRPPDIAAKHCIADLALSLWRHTGKRPTRVTRSDTGKNELSRLHDLTKLVIGPVLEFHGLRRPASYAGKVRSVLDALPDVLPSGRTFNDLNSQGPEQNVTLGGLFGPMDG